MQQTRFKSSYHRLRSVSLRKWVQKEALVQMLGSIEKLLKLLRNSEQKSFDWALVKDLGIDVNAAQVLQPRHARELMRTKVDTLFELRILYIVLDYKNYLIVHKLLQHNQTAQRMRSRLSDLQESAVPYNGPHRRVMLQGNHQLRGS